MKELAEKFFELLDRIGLLRLLEMLEFQSGRVRIVTYHRVGRPEDDPALEPGLISASLAEFEGQMNLLASRYNPISLQQLVDAQAGRLKLPARSVLVTFDDAYQDFADVAWPVMKRIGIPVVLFAPTAFPAGKEQGFWWDRLSTALMRTELSSIDLEVLGRLDLIGDHAKRQAYKRTRTHVKSLPHFQAMAWVDQLVESLGGLPDINRVLDWDQLRELAAQGVSVCSHGRDHALMTRLNEEELREDLAESLQKIESELGQHAPPRALAYPANATSQTVRDASRDAGYVIAFGGRRGVNRVPVSDAFEFMRVPALRYRRGLFRAQLRPSISWIGGYLLELRGSVRT